MEKNIKTQNTEKEFNIDENLLNWKDWKWQIKHSIRDIDTFEKITGIKFDEEKRSELDKTVNKFPLSITPYYLSLIDTQSYLNDPIYKQCFPSISELIVEEYDMKDPLAEEKDSPVKGITHRYPDRVLFIVSNVCAMYCRHCTRKRKVGDIDCIPNKSEVLEGIKYISENKNIRDVLLSGGDPFMLPDEYLDWILSEIRAINHIEVIRIGSRIPAVLPYRITDKLVDVLKKYHPLWLNTQFNHPREITKASKEAIKKLADAGIPVGNQSVLLAGINDCPKIIKKLVHKLVQNRIRPYYLYQCDLSEGLSHFRTPVAKGIEIIENLIGHTSGFAVPTFVIDAPDGAGKIPLMPNYYISCSDKKVVLRNYEGMITTYKEPDHYESKNCDLECTNCKLQIESEKDESDLIGIAKLLGDSDSTISLLPMDSERLERRNDEW